MGGGGGLGVDRSVCYLHQGSVVLGGGTSGSWGWMGRSPMKAFMKSTHESVPFKHSVSRCVYVYGFI